MNLQLFTLLCRIPGHSTGGSGAGARRAEQAGVPVSPALAQGQEPGTRGIPGCKTLKGVTRPHRHPCEQPPRRFGAVPSLVCCAVRWNGVAAELRWLLLVVPPAQGWLGRGHGEPHGHPTAPGQCPTIGRVSGDRSHSSAPQARPGREGRERASVLHLCICLSLRASPSPTHPSIFPSIRPSYTSAFSIQPSVHPPELSICLSLPPPRRAACPGGLCLRTVTRHPVRSTLCGHLSPSTHEPGTMVTPRHSDPAEAPRQGRQHPPKTQAPGAARHPLSQTTTIHRRIPGATVRGRARNLRDRGCDGHFAVKTIRSLVHPGFILRCCLRFGNGTGVVHHRITLPVAGGHRGGRFTLLPRAVAAGNGSAHDAPELSAPNPSERMLRAPGTSPSPQPTASPLPALRQLPARRSRCPAPACKRRAGCTTRSRAAQPSRKALGDTHARAAVTIPAAEQTPRGRHPSPRRGGRTQQPAAEGEFGSFPWCWAIFGRGFPERHVWFLRLIVPIASLLPRSTRTPPRTLCPHPPVPKSCGFSIFPPHSRCNTPRPPEGEAGFCSRSSLPQNTNPGHACSPKPAGIAPHAGGSPSPMSPGAEPLRVAAAGAGRALTPSGIASSRAATTT